MNTNTIIIPKYCCAEYNKDTNSFQPTDAWLTEEEMLDELEAYTCSERTPQEHNDLEHDRPLSERVIFVHLDDLELESNRQMMNRNTTLSQHLNYGDGGADTFIPNWYEREHFESFIGRRFENNEEYEDFLETFQRTFGNHIAGTVSVLVESLAAEMVEEG